MIRRDAAIDDGEPLWTFRGRMLHERRVTYFVTLAVFTSGVELRSTYSFLRVIVPVWRARYDELSEVQSIGRPDLDGSLGAQAPFQARGVRLVAADGAYITFLCPNRDEVLAFLDQQPVTVDFEPRRY